VGLELGGEERGEQDDHHQEAADRPQRLLAQKRAEDGPRPGRRRPMLTLRHLDPERSSGHSGRGGSRKPIEHVDDQIRDDDHDAMNMTRFLDDRIVPPEDRLHQEAREPGQVEEGLGHHEPTDEEGELDADDGDHGQDRVSAARGARSRRSPTGPWPARCGM